MMKFSNLYLLTILATLFLSLGCGQDFNSNSYDGIGSAPCPDPGDPLLCESFKIIQASCIRCHSGEHSAWSTYQSITDYVNAGLIDATGNAAASPLITRLRLYAPSGNMPPSGYTLAPDHFDTLVDWVESL